MLDIIPSKYHSRGTPGSALPPTSDQNTISRTITEHLEKQRYLKSTYTTIAIDPYLTNSTKDHVNNINGPHSQKPTIYIPPDRADNLPDRENKQTPQPDKTVTIEPTVAADDEKPNTTNAQ